MYYVTHFGTSYVPKNKLQEEIQKFVKSMNAIGLTDENIAQFKFYVLQEIEKLNQKHKRCAPVKAEFITDQLNEKEPRYYTLSFGGLSLCHYHIYLGKPLYNNINRPTTPFSEPCKR